MLKRIRDFALYGDTDRESFHTIKKKIEDYNRIMSLCFASVASLLISVMVVLSFSQEGFAASRPVYICGIIFSVLQIAVSLAAKRFPVLSYISVYMGISIFMFYGIAIATLTRAEEQTVTFMVMIIFVPLIFVDRPIRMAITLTFYIILFIIMACGTKSGSVLSVDITDAIIFGLLSIVSETVVYRAKIRSYVLEAQLHVISETDQLTGLNNRNSYELKIGKYPFMYRFSICCIYIDVNGLHELNNMRGHKAGDDMLCQVAEELKKQFGSRDSYRVGGDEYVTFVMDESQEEIDRKLGEMQKQIEERGYHVAIGYEFIEEKRTDINKLIVQAETKMYKNKSEYYRDHDRRGR